MSREALLRRRIGKLEDEVARAGREGDGRGLRRAGIANLYLELGDRRSAAHWLLEAARQAEFSELPILALAHVRRAKELAPGDLEVAREHRRLTARLMPWSAGADWLSDSRDGLAP